MHVALKLMIHIPRMAYMYVVMLLVLFVAQATAHVCLLYPHQRGSMQGLNSPGELKVTIVP